MELRHLALLVALAWVPACSSQKMKKPHDAAAAEDDDATATGKPKAKSKTLKTAGEEAATDTATATATDTATETSAAVSGSRTMTFGVAASVANWGSVIAATAPTRTFVADFTGDKKDDFLFVAVDGTWWVGASDGAKFNFSLWKSEPVWGPIMATGSAARTFTGDVNGDGKADFIFTFSDGSVWVGLSQGNAFAFAPWFGKPEWGPIFDARSSSRIMVGDVTGDGKDDVVFTFVDGSIWVGVSDGSRFNFVEFHRDANWGQVLTATSAARTWLADVNGDGKKDFVFTFNDGSWWVGVSNGQKFVFQGFHRNADWGPVIAAPSATRAFMGDVTGDGKSDFVMLTADGAWWVGVSDGASFKFGLWGKHPEYAALLAREGKAEAFVVEATGDKRADLVFTDDKGNVIIAASTEANDFQPKAAVGNAGWSTVLQRGSGARFFAGDVSGDGKADFLFTFPDGNWWLAK